MNTNEDKYIDLIDKHLQDNLSREEEILSDQNKSIPTFRKLLEETTAVKSAVNTFELRRVKSMLEKVEVQNSEVQNSIAKSISLNFSKIIRVAAIFVGVSLLSWLFYTQYNSRSPSYMAKYFTPQKNTLVSIDKSSPNNSEIAQAFSKYESGEYADFIYAIRPFHANQINDDFLFYEANALMATSKVNEAITILEAIVSRKTINNLSDAQWLLAIAYLDTNRKTEAQMLMNVLLDDGFYAPKAEEILSQTQ